MGPHAIIQAVMNGPHQQIQPLQRSKSLLDIGQSFSNLGKNLDHLFGAFGRGFASITKDMFGFGISARKVVNDFIKLWVTAFQVQAAFLGRLPGLIAEAIVEAINLILRFMEKVVNFLFNPASATAVGANPVIG